MLVADFTFNLPSDLIAQHPPAQRDGARMLTVDRSSGALGDRHFRDLPSLLHEGDLLILNDSRVIPARLYARRVGLRTQANSPTPSGLIEVLLTRRLNATDWSALVKPGRKVQPGEVLHFVEVTPSSSSFEGIFSNEENGSRESGNHRRFADAPVAVNPVHTASDAGHGLLSDETGSTLAASLLHPGLSATVVAAGEHGERTLRFASSPGFFSELDRLGHVPLPPYLHRPDNAQDRSRYQTVYAGADTHGSAAAPTAGLHFTQAILDQLKKQGVEIQHVTLHVGLGTFQPVRVLRLEDIHLHAEPYTLPVATADALNRARREGRRIVAAGTTAVRTLEHCAAVANADAARPFLGDTTQRELQSHSSDTSIFLSPGHRFRLVDSLLTNLHLPQSTLLMLVCAFGGTRHVLQAYEHAIAQRYRFFSYGDCMFLSDPCLTAEP